MPTFPDFPPTNNAGTPPGRGRAKRVAKRRAPLPPPMVPPPMGGPLDSVPAMDAGIGAGPARAAMRGRRR